MIGSRDQAVPRLVGCGRRRSGTQARRKESQGKETPLDYLERLNLSLLERPSIEDREIELSSRLIVKEKAGGRSRLIMNMEAERKTS